MQRSLLTALAAAMLALMPAAHAQTTTTGATAEVKDWDVFVDLPTRFAFVKTPMGWKFVRQLDAEQVAHLHPTTLVSLLPAADDAGLRLAHPALEPSPRVQAALRAQPRLAQVSASVATSQ